MEERLQRLRGRSTAIDLAEEIMKISKRCSEIPDQDQRSPDEIKNVICIFGLSSENTMTTGNYPNGMEKRKNAAIGLCGGPSGIVLDWLAQFVTHIHNKGKPAGESDIMAISEINWACSIQKIYPPPRLDPIETHLDMHRKSNVLSFRWH
ncbi:MAG: type II toxin-antitoxin system VapB family antitoxin [bacterium]|nr:type II toxin-antitoxin system VapB family antitoxin [bacterium]